jgi:TRAP-type uncharacterized transport system substrate-binding protein
MRRRGIAVVVAAVAVSALVGAWAASRFGGPLPPRRLVISTGREDGAYHAFARDYQRILAAQGFTLEIRPGPGSIETLRRLSEGEVTVGFVQGGLTQTGRTPGLTALASVFFEPLWVFHRAALPVRYLADLRGRRVAVGEAGSGTQPVATRLLADSGVSADNTTLLALRNDEAEAALRDGSADAALFVLSPRSSIVLRLLEQPGIALMSERQALAYAGRYPHVTGLRLGEGMLDVERNRPREEKTVLAVAATLVARDDIHPAHVRLLLGTAEKVHHRGGLLERDGQFPSETLVDLPLHDAARRYLRSGPPWLERVLPLWAAGLVDRTILVALPMLTLLFPFFGLILPLTDRRHRLRIARWYEELRACDVQCDALGAEDLDARIRRMRQLQREVTEQRKVPPIYIGDLYNLKMHTGFVLERLEQRRRGLADPRARQTA